MQPDRFDSLEREMKRYALLRAQDEAAPVPAGTAPAPLGGVVGPADAGIAESGPAERELSPQELEACQIVARALVRMVTRSDECRLKSEQCGGAR